MREPNEPFDDGVLDRAVAALRDVPTPPGPDWQLRQRTLERIELADRAMLRNYLFAAAAAVLLIACCIPIVLHAHREAVRSNEEARQLQIRINTPTPPAPPPLPHQDPELPTPKPAPVVLASNVSISGQIYYHGPRPERHSIDLASCPQCAEVVHGTIYDDSLLVNDNGELGNVVISISAGLPPGEQFPIPQNPAVLDQRGCMFHPHVIATMVGQPILVKNSDPFMHSVHSMDAERSPAFDFAQPTTGLRQVEPLQIVETFQVKCDLHPWMSAWVRVFNHPYFAVSSPDGSYSIRQLPPGRYRLKAWHELLGVRETSVEVRDDRPAIINFTFDR